MGETHMSKLTGKGKHQLPSHMTEMGKGTSECVGVGVSWPGLKQ